MWKRLGSAAIVLAALAAVGVLCLTRASEVGAALERIPAWAIAAAVALHVATLVLRSEAWRVTLSAAHGETLPRGVVHAANAGSFVAGCVQSGAALPARLILLRRMAGPRAPRPGVILVADASIFSLELCATALLLAGALVIAGGAWWISAPLACAAVCAAWPALRRRARRSTPAVSDAVRRMAPWLRRLLARPSIVRGLAVFRGHRQRRALATIVAGIVALTLARVWLVLTVCGLPHGYTDVVLVFAFMGIFGLLPIGPGAAPGATVAALAGASLAASVAAGLMLGASSILAVFVYALLVALQSRAPRRRRRLLSPAPLAAGS